MAIPTYESRASLNALPGARVRSAATPEAYGSGAISAGQKFIGAAIEKQQEFEYAEALEAVNMFQADVDKLHLDPDKGLYNTRKLGAASGMGQDADTSMREIAQQYYAKMSSPFMKNAFTEQARRILFQQNRANSKWESGEVETYKSNEAAASQVNAYNKISLYFDDDEMVAVERQNILDALEYQLRGAGTEERAAKMAEMESNIAMVRVNQVVAKSPLEAEAWLEANKDSFLPEMYAKVKGNVERLVEPYKVEAIRDDILSRIPDEGAALDYIRENYDGDMEKKIASSVKAVFSDDRRIQNQREADAYDAMQDAVASSGSYSAALSAISRSGLPPRLKDALSRQARSKFGVGSSSGGGGGSGRVKVDPDVWIDARTEAMTFQANAGNMTLAERNEAAKAFVAKYTGKVSGSGLQTLSNMFFSKSGGSAGSGKDPYNKFNPMTRVGQMVTAAGISKDVNEEIEFWNEYSARANAQEAELGREMNAEEHIELGRKLTGETIVSKKNNLAEVFISSVAGKFGVNLQFDKDETTSVKGYKVPSGAIWDEDEGVYVKFNDDGTVSEYEP